MDAHEIANGLLGAWPSIVFMGAVVIMLIAYIADKLNDDK